MDIENMTTIENTETSSEMKEQYEIKNEGKDRKA
jgi:hypothetical protein